MNYLFDTHALITLFHNEPGHEIVQSIFEEIENGKADGFISTVTLTELKYLYFKRFGEDESEKRLHPILTSNLTIIPVTISIALSAGSIKKAGISLADAIIASTAREIQAVVVTGDTHFSEMGIEMKKYM
ncbi:PilT protein-like protein [Methanospirillum hungatei JF-1]|jgi:predicted nucleic acid-binding protein|uniref:PilT protein-like protein n=2 Tax=Methanospirillum hungatei TaxID=2203 RepID=Q2FMD9_METHJ|nr:MULTISPECIES: type II toxin-antitoxin system VapC family toxin [Methanospirillum]ABD41623.1 PilT protein-like protein [Methanospirillum hungatei JF-1]MBP9007170.1 type II toxin-antitoxin system VapC family toxin [Methanospirillum sp.]